MVEAMTDIDLELSVELCEDHGCQPSACWWNAYNVVSFDDRALYVEGFARSGRTGLVVEHAWVEYMGQIIDPTPSWNGKDDGPMAFTPGAYFPGRKYTQTELLELAKKYPHEDTPYDPDDPESAPDPDLPLVWRYGGWGGFKDASYKDAYISAWAHGGAMDYETTERWLRGEDIFAGRKAAADG